MYMYEHFENIKKIFGKNIYVQMPNGIFLDLAKIDKNIQQISFCFSYLVTISFLYKYAHFVDINNGTYIQNSDIKEILGYNRKTKTVDKYIKKGGVLEALGLVETTRDYPVDVEYTEEELNDVNMREIKTISMLDTDNINYSIIKSIVKNRNYTVKVPTFLFDYKGDVGTMYNYENTFKVTLDEFLTFAYSEDLDNTDFILYCYFKSKCYGLKKNMNQIALNRIVAEIGIKKDSFYNHLEKLKKKKLIDAIHKGWQIGADGEEIEANDYYFNGIC